MSIPLSERHWQVMGVVNITPDSFSDGGRYFHRDQALRHAEQLLAEGADVLDLGAESTRPGAIPVSLDEELDRLMPVLEGIRQLTDKPLSVDTYKAQVMREALLAGADWINDISALADPQALPILAEYPHSRVCIMHIQGTPATMQNNPSYADVCHEVSLFLQHKQELWSSAGLASERLLLDPGFGFGKTLAQNIALFKGIPQLAKQGCPVLIGVSRKRMIGELLARPQPLDRMAGSVAAAVEAVRYGASVVRVHDVAQTVDALSVMQLLGNHYHQSSPDTLMTSDTQLSTI